MTDVTSPSQSMRAVSRIAAILGSFRPSQPELTLTQVAQASGLDKNTVRRLLLALCETGMVEHRGDLYTLGVAVLKLQPAVARVMPLREAAAPFLHVLTHGTQMSSFAWMPDETSAVCVERARIDTVQIEAAWSSTGRSIPLHLASGPRAILAHLGSAQRQAYLARPLLARTPFSLTDPAALEAEAAKIRAEGHAFVADDFVVGLAGLAVPVFDRRGGLAGSVSVTARSDTLAEPEVFTQALSALKEAAAAIGIRLQAQP